MLAKTGYVMLGALTLARRRVQLAGWRGRVGLVAIALSIASLCGLELHYGLGLRWGRHEIHLEKRESQPASMPQRLGVTASGDLVWLHPSP